MEVFALVLSLAQPLVLFASEEGDTGRSLSVGRAVQLALTQNRTLIQARHRLKVEAAGLELEMTKYNAKQLFETKGGQASQNQGQGSRNVDLDPRADGFPTLPLEPSSGRARSNFLTATYGLTQEILFPESTGGRLSLQLDAGLERYESSNSPSSNSYLLGPKISFTYKQPLTREGIFSGKSALTDAKLAYTEAEVAFEQVKEDVLFEVMAAYAQLLRDQKVLEVAREALNVIRQQIETTEAQVQLGVLAEIELVKLRVQLSLGQNEVMQAEKTEQSTHEKLRNLLGLSPGVQLHLIPLAPFQPTVLDLKKSESLALINRADLRRLNIQRQTDDLAIHVANSQDDPFFTVSGIYSWRGSGHTFHEAQDNIGDNEWGLSAGFTIPLRDGGTSRAQARKATAEKRSKEVEIDALRQQIRIELEEAFRVLQLSERQFEVGKSNLELAEEAFKIEQFRFSRGQITVTDLLQSQLALLQIKQALNGAAIDHFMGEAQLQKASGTLSETFESLGEK